MSSIYSKVYSSDAIEEGKTDYQYSYADKSINSQIYTPSKRSILRDVNRIFKNQMNQMEFCLNTVKNKYQFSQETHQKYKSNFSMPAQIQKIQRTIFSDAKSTNIQNFSNAYQSVQNEIFQKNHNYQQTLEQQKNLNQQIQTIKQILAHRISPNSKIQLQQYPQQRVQIDWSLLMRQDSESPYRQLLKTSAKSKVDQCGMVPSKEYIAYTQTNSILFDRNATCQSQEIQECVSYNSKKHSKTKTKTNLNNYQQKPLTEYHNKQKIYEDIQNRIKNSTCVVGKIIHSKQIDRTNQLFNRLSKQKDEREKLIKKIKFQFK